MKTSLSLIALSLLMSTSAFARIVKHKDGLYIEANGNRSPIYMVNSMIKEKSISNLKLYKDGKIHVLSFSKHKGPVKLYSVDEKGYIYAIEPFSNYSISSVEENGKFTFNEVPNKKFIVDAKGFFLY